VRASAEWKRQDRPEGGLAVALGQPVISPAEPSGQYRSHPEEDALSCPGCRPPQGQRARPQNQPTRRLEAMCELCTIKEEICQLRSIAESFRADLLQTLNRIKRPAATAPSARQACAYLTGRQAAGLLGLSPRTLESWRLTGEGPPFMKFGRKVVYAVDDLRAWTEERRRRSTSDSGR
jgi:hypothetical protein